MVFCAMKTLCNYGVCVTIHYKTTFLHLQNVTFLLQHTVAITLILFIFTKLTYHNILLYFEFYVYLHFQSV